MHASNRATKAPKRVNNSHCRTLEKTSNFFLKPVQSSPTIIKLESDPINKTEGRRHAQQALREHFSGQIGRKIAIHNGRWNCGLSDTMCRRLFRFHFRSHSARFYTAWAFSTFLASVYQSSDDEIQSIRSGIQLVCTETCENSKACQRNICITKRNIARTNLLSDDNN